MTTGTYAGLMKPDGVIVPGDPAARAFHRHRRFAHPLSRPGLGAAPLLIHGLAGQMRHFTYSLLDMLKSDYRVVIVDRPGSGYSTRPPQASAAIFAQARTLGQFAEALRLERPLVVGHSLGGAIALSLALNHPEQVGGLGAACARDAPAGRAAAGVSRARNQIAAHAPDDGLDAWRYPCRSGTPRPVLDVVFGPQPVPADFGNQGRRPVGAAAAQLHHRLAPTSLRPRRFRQTCRPATRA